jgi:uncharacterized protein YdeI (YjbR/CyaY-like superfamily)
MKVPAQEMAPQFFASASLWREWLEANHAKETELVVGFYKRDSGRPSMTWSESVDEAICFGWIDGVTRSIDANSYCKRYSVRQPGSIWSKVNIAKAESLIAQGRMTAAGLAKFRARSAARSGIYAFEQGAVEFEAAAAAEFQAHPAAWEFFQQQAPSYRKKVTWWVVSARQALTRQKRLALLIDASANRQQVGALAEKRYKADRRPPRAIKK